MFLLQRILCSFAFEFLRVFKITGCTAFNRGSFKNQSLVNGRFLLLHCSPDRYIILAALKVSTVGTHNQAAETAAGALNSSELELQILTGVGI